MLLVINYGGQYCHLIARRIRELGVVAEVIPFDSDPNEVKRMNPAGIILSGGPSSVYDYDAPISDPKILELNIPVLGICYGQQLIGKQLKGKVAQNKIKEYGKKEIKVVKKDSILKGLKDKENVWMSHGDAIEDLPDGFQTLASTDTCQNASIGNTESKIFGVQFHPEVVHTESGQEILKNFLFEVCKANKDYNVKDMGKKLIQEIKDEVKDDHVIMGVSGGVDSTVAATLINQAIGKKLHGVFIDHGLCRKNEMKQVEESYQELGLNMQYVDASKIFLKRLKNVTDPERKRKIIGKTFIDVFEKEAKKLEKTHKKIKFLAQGTIYPDRIESAQPSKQADKIKSHHNIALPDKMKLKVIEPLKEFYKDGVRELGEQLKVPKDLIDRHPFPGPGLAVRILGKITPERIKVLQEADTIFIDELRQNNLYNETWQAFAVLLPVKTVGVMGDARTYENIISLRAVNSVDAMTADWTKLPYEFLELVSNRIINEVQGVNRVVYDISQKPPSTIEYE